MLKACHVKETLLDLMIRAIPTAGVLLVPEVGVPLLHTHADAAPSAVWQEPILVAVIQGAKLLSMVDRPQQLQVLGPALRRELHFGALCSPAGACLREMACQGSRA